MPWAPLTPASDLAVWGRHGSCYFPGSLLWYLLRIALVAFRRKGHSRNTYLSCQVKRLLAPQRVET